jgi:hypothetical protein
VVVLELIVCPAIDAPTIARRVVISRADEYRAKAAECDHRAAATPYSDIKEQFEDLARSWREMAKQAERIFHD